jgi:hypothetical protein
MANTAQPGTKISSLLILVMAAIIGAVAGVTTMTWLGGARGTASIDAELVKVCDTINRTLPMMVDQMTRLDVTMALPGRVMFYKYTLLGERPVPDAGEFEQAFRPKLVNQYQTSTEMAALRKANVKLVYAYFDEQSRELTRIEITPEVVKQVQ